MIEIPQDAKCAVTPKQYEAIRIIGEHGIITNSELMATMGVSNMSNLITQLCRQGYITRGVIPPDYKTRHIQLTDKGRKVLEG